MSAVPESTASSVSATPSSTRTPSFPDNWPIGMLLGVGQRIDEDVFSASVSEALIISVDAFVLCFFFRSYLASALRERAREVPTKSLNAIRRPRRKVDERRRSGGCVSSTGASDPSSVFTNEGV
jgi:hypothetical protein